MGGGAGSYFKLSLQQASGAETRASTLPLAPFLGCFQNLIGQLQFLEFVRGLGITGLHVGMHFLCASTPFAFNRLKIGVRFKICLLYTSDAADE